MIKVAQHIFRGYDLRGLADSELNNEAVDALGKGYATWLLKRRVYSCVVGHDCRLSSPKIHDQIVKSLLESGITVYDIGITLTQIAYFAQYLFRTRGMIMITASHNPKEYNGFKFGIGFSETMLTDDILSFRALVNAGRFLKTGKIGKHNPVTYHRIILMMS